MNQKNRRKIQWQKTTVMQTIQTKTHSQKNGAFSSYSESQNSSKNCDKNTTKNASRNASKNANKNADKNSAKSAMSYGGNKNCGKIRDAFDESDKY